MQAFEVNCRRLEWGMGQSEMRHRGSYAHFSPTHLSAGSVEVLLRGQSLIDRSVKRRIKGCR